MSDTDVDSPTALATSGRDPHVKLPWESMDPAAPASYSADEPMQDSDSAATATQAVATGPGRKKANPKARKPRKTSRPAPLPEATPEVEAALASQAFLSDASASSSGGPKDEATTGVAVREIGAAGESTLADAPVQVVADVISEALPTESTPGDAIVAEAEVPVDGAMGSDVDLGAANPVPQSSSIAIDSAEAAVSIPVKVKKLRKRAASAKAPRRKTARSSKANSADATISSSNSDEPPSIEHTPWATIDDAPAASTFNNQPSATPDMMASAIDWPMRSNDDDPTSFTTYAPAQHELAVTSSEHPVAEPGDAVAFVSEQPDTFTGDRAPGAEISATFDHADIHPQEFTTRISVDSAGSDPNDGPVAISQNPAADRLEDMSGMDGSCISFGENHGRAARATDFEIGSPIKTAGPASRFSVDASDEAWESASRIAADTLGDNTHDESVSFAPAGQETRDAMGEEPRSSPLPQYPEQQEDSDASESSITTFDDASAEQSAYSTSAESATASEEPDVAITGQSSHIADALVSPVKVSRFSNALIDAPTAAADARSDSDSTAPRSTSFDGHVTVFRELPAPAAAPVPATPELSAASEGPGDETTAMFAMTDPVLIAASEVATHAEKLRQSQSERAGDQKILVNSPRTASEPQRTTAAPLAALAAPVEPEPQVELMVETGPTTTTAGGGWTIPLMCLGIGLIACCVAIPQIDANRRLAYERMALTAELESVQKQVTVNDQFLHKVSDDPTLAERLAARQMKTIRRGHKVLAMNDVSEDSDMSPFTLTTVPHPAPPAPYKPINGTIANICYNARSRLYLLGLAMTMAAAGLVMGFVPVKTGKAEQWVEV